MESNEEQGSPNEASKVEWIEYRFLPTPGFNNDWRYGQRSTPMVDYWLFTRSGTTGVSINEGSASDLDVFLLDVHNKIWFGNSIWIPDFEFKNLFTYHMLNETTLIVIEICEESLVKQHIIKVNMKTRTSEFMQTIFHSFVRRDTFPIREFINIVPHVPITLGKKNYTPLVRRITLNPLRVVVYLVPLNPLSDCSPMEFSVLVELPAALLPEWRADTGSNNHDYLFEFSNFASNGRLYFVCYSCDPPMENIRMISGVFLTVDVSKLIDIYDMPIGEMDQMNLHADQVESFSVVRFPWLLNARPMSGCRLGFRGILLIFQNLPSVESNVLEDTTIYLLDSMRSFRVKSYQDAWPGLYPGGAVLQFKMSPQDKRLFVRVAAHWKNTLASIANIKLIFHPNRPIDSIEGLHRIIFYGLPPIPLDEAAEKALAPYRNYKKMFKNVDSFYEKGHPFLQLKALRMLLVPIGIPTMILLFIQLYLFLI